MPEPQDWSAKVRAKVQVKPSDTRHIAIALIESRGVANPPAALIDMVEWLVQTINQSAGIQ